MEKPELIILLSNTLEITEASLSKLLKQANEQSHPKADALNASLALIGKKSDKRNVPDPAQNPEEAELYLKGLRRILTREIRRKDLESIDADRILTGIKSLP